MKEGKIFWLTRDAAEIHDEFRYNIHRTKKMARIDDYGIFQDMDLDMCDTDFEKITGIKLKPGEGPVKCRLILED